MTQGLLLISSLAYIVCFIMVLIKMFQHGDKTVGIACIVLALCGLGSLIAFIYGWMNVGKYNIMLVMIIFTVAALMLGPSIFLTGSLDLIGFN